MSWYHVSNWINLKKKEKYFIMQYIKLGLNQLYRLQQNQSHFLAPWINKGGKSFSYCKILKKLANLSVCYYCASTEYRFFKEHSNQ